MRCSVAKKLISEYIDGSLEASKSFRLEQHLDTCLDCHELLRNFQKIVEGAKKLGKISPSEHTWLRIKERLETQEQEVLALRSRKAEWFKFLFSPPKLKYVFSTAVLLAVVVGAVTMGVQYWKGRKALAREDLKKYTIAKLEEAEHYYQLAIRALWEAAVAQEGTLDPQVAVVFRKNLDAIDSSIVACKKAVLSEPDNIENRNYLLAAYQGKVDFLNEMMRTKKESPQKGELKTTI
ncbi:MAG: anti-sigma factor [Candidatus Aminicenantaceae bacterium]